MTNDAFKQPNIFTMIQKQYPTEYQEALDIHYLNKHEIILIMPNGPSLSYCDLDNSIRPIPTADANEFIDKYDFAKEFGIRLRRMMKDKNISQAKLAKKVEFDETAISKYVLGLSVPSIHRACKMAWALDCDLAELIYY